MFVSMCVCGCVCLCMCEWVCVYACVQGCVRGRQVEWGGGRVEVLTFVFDARGTSKGELFKKSCATHVLSECLYCCG